MVINGPGNIGRMSNNRTSRAGAMLRFVRGIGTYDRSGREETQAISKWSFWGVEVERINRRLIFFVGGAISPGGQFSCEVCLMWAVLCGRFFLWAVTENRL